MKKRESKAQLKCMQKQSLVKKTKHDDPEGQSTNSDTQLKEDLQQDFLSFASSKDFPIKKLKPADENFSKLTKS